MKLASMFLLVTEMESIGAQNYSFPGFPQSLKNGDILESISESYKEEQGQREINKINYDKLYKARFDKHSQSATVISPSHTNIR